MFNENWNTVLSVFITDICLISAMAEFNYKNGQNTFKFFNVDITKRHRYSY